MSLGRALKPVSRHLVEQAMSAVHQPVHGTEAEEGRRLFQLNGIESSDISRAIGGTSARAQDVLAAYLDCFDFAGLTLVQALRYDSCCPA